MDRDLFTVSRMKEVHVVLTDGAFNTHHFWIEAFSLADAISQAREKAIRNNYRMPYHLKSIEYENSPPGERASAKRWVNRPDYNEG